MFPEINLDQFAEPELPKAVTLYDFQEEDRSKVASAFLDRGLTRLLGVWPTGTGKTVLFSELHLEPRLQSWLSAFPVLRQRILVIAHRDELITQAVAKLQRSNPYLAIGVEKADRRAAPHCDVVVASVQTLTANRGKRLKKLNPDSFKIIVIDEAHHAASPSYHAIFHHFGFLPPAEFMAESRPKKTDGRAALLAWQRERLSSWDALYKPNRLLFGVTATAKRGDKVGLECVFQDIAFERSIREMIERGKLCPLKAYRVTSTTSLDEVGTRAGDFEQEKLAQTINVTQRNALAVKSYLEYAHGRKGITFCANVAHAVSMADSFNQAGVRAAVIHGGMAEGERKRILKDYAAGQITMLTNCNILTEGFDEPNVQVIIHARPTKSALLYIQMTGRGTRIAEGKQNCIIIDIVDLTKKHSLMTSPELFGLPVDFDAKGGDLLEAKKSVEAIQAAHPLADISDAKSLEDCQLKVTEVDLFGAFHDEHLDTHAKLAWEKVDGGYEISWVGRMLNEFLQVTPSPDGQWQATYKKGSKPVHAKSFPSPEAALKYAEQWLHSNQSGVWALNLKSGKQDNAPATASQQAFLQKMGIKGNLAALTKGEARLLMNQFYAKQRRYS